MNWDIPDTIVKMFVLSQGGGLTMDTELQKLIDLGDAKQCVTADLLTFPEYWVTKDGRLYREKYSDEASKNRKGKWLKPQLVEGYFKFDLRNKEASIRIKRGKLVKLAFHGPPPESIQRPVLRHLNDIKTDDFLSNLEWGTYLQNYEDAVRNGRFVSPEHPKGGAHANAVYTESQIRAVKILRSNGATYSEISQITRVGQWTIGEVLAGRAWKHIL